MVNHNQDTAVTSAGTNGEQNGGKPATSTTGQDAAQSNGPQAVAQPGNDASAKVMIHLKLMVLIIQKANLL